MRDPAFPTFCALGIILCFLPLPWHWKARNTGTLLYIGWVSLGCANMLINSLLWAGHTRDLAPVWCNISINITKATGIGIMCSTLCIQRRLYGIATIKYVSYTTESKRRDLIVDLILGIGVTIVYVALGYVASPNKYDIIEDVGCWHTDNSTLVLVPTSSIWLIVISSASCVYGGLTVRAFFKTRRQFSRVLSDSASGLNMSRYFRLMALASGDAVISLPMSIFIMVSNLTSDEIKPWISWEDTHRNFNEVGVLSYDDLRALGPISQLGLELNKWLIPGAAFLFFAFFGMSQEATQEYSRIIWSLYTSLGFKRPDPKPSPNPWSSRPAAVVSLDLSAAIVSHSPSEIEPVARDQTESHLKEQDITQVKNNDLEV